MKHLLLGKFTRFIDILLSIEHGFVLVYRFTRADTKDQTMYNSKAMTPEQRKNNGYSLVNRYTRTERLNLSHRDIGIFTTRLSLFDLSSFVWKIFTTRCFI